MVACTQVPRDAASTADSERRATARIELAKAYFAEGSHAIALEEVNRALEVAPQRADAHSLRALAQRRYLAPANAAMNAGTCSLRLGDRVRA